MGAYRIPQFVSTQLLDLSRGSANERVCSVILGLHCGLEKLAESIAMELYMIAC